MNRLSAVVVTYNEENNIKECLTTVQFAEEVLVIDSHSSDKTAEIARDFKAKVIMTDLVYPEEKKNLGIKKAEGNWVLVVDADERVTRELRIEIEEAIKKSEYSGYWIYRKNFFIGREIKFCGWNRDRIIRLFRKEAGRYPDKRVHGNLILDGRSGVMKGRLEHYSYRSIDDYFNKVSRYTKWSALDLTGKKTGWHKLVVNPAARFIKMYFFRLGFLDGVTGFALCVMASFSVFTKYLRLYLQKD